MTAAIAFAFLKSNWRLVLAGMCVALALAGWGYVQHLQHTVTVQKAQVKVATTQAAVAQNTTDVINHYAHDVTVIHERSANAVQQVQQAPTAQQALDPGLRSSLCAQLASVRGTSVCADPVSPQQPAGAVQGAH